MEVKTLGEVKVAVMDPKFDSYVARDIEEVLKGLIKDGAKRLLCNFSQTNYISSAGLRVLLVITKELGKAGGTIVLCCLSEFVQEVFQTSGFTRIFKIFASEEEALKSFQ